MRQRLATYFNVHLVSDSTGETLAGVMRATCAQFDNIMPIEHSYFLVRSVRQLERVLEEIAGAPGVVMFTLSNLEHRAILEEHCAKVGMPCVAVLDPVLDITSRYLGQELNHRVGAARKLNAEYFKRIDALDFAMDHDDGQQVVELSRDYVSPPENVTGTTTEREILADELRREMAASILRRVDGVIQGGAQGRKPAP